MSYEVTGDYADYSFSKPFFSGSGYCYPSCDYKRYYDCGAAGNNPTSGGARKKRSKSKSKRKTKSRSKSKSKRSSKSRSKSKSKRRTKTSTGMTAAAKKIQSKLMSLVKKAKTMEKSAEKKMKKLMRKTKRKLSLKEKKKRPERRKKARKHHVRCKKHRRMAEMRLKKHMRKHKTRKTRKVKHRGGSNNNPAQRGPMSSRPASEWSANETGQKTLSHCLVVRSPVGVLGNQAGGACCSNQPEEFVRVKAGTPGGSFLFNNYGAAFKTSSGGAMKKKMESAAKQLKNALDKLKNKIVGKKKETGKKRRKSRSHKGGATPVPMRWYDPNFGTTGKGVAVVPSGMKGASCLKSAYGPIIGESFPRTNLAPFPKATGQQTGGKRRKVKRKKSTPKKKRSVKKRQMKKKR